MHDQQSQPKLQLTYPCEWAYVLIGANEEELRSAIKNVIADKSHTATLSHTSAKGTYVSLKVLVVVRDDDERAKIYNAFQRHPATKLVL
jgi:putative lipoic acid-binding regulatory protein